MTNEKELEQLSETIHIWYLEATRELHPESYNPNAQKQYSDLTEEQKFIDRYMAKRIVEKLHSHKTEIVQKIEKHTFTDMGDYYAVKKIINQEK